MRDEEDYTFRIFGEFDLEKAEDFCFWVDSKKNEPRDTLIIVINSLGGESFALQSMLDVLNSTHHEVITYGTGAVMSCGFELFIAGDHRILYEGCLCMAHQFNWGTNGKYHELKVDTKQFELEYKRQVQFFVNNSKLTKAQVKRDVLHETDKYFSNKEMIKRGFADKIIFKPKRRKK